jgi:hypothetical protein
MYKNVLIICNIHDTEFSETNVRTYHTNICLGSSWHSNPNRLVFAERVGDHSTKPSNMHLTYDKFFMIQEYAIWEGHLPPFS